MTTKYNAQALMDEVRKEHPRVSGYTLAVFAAQRAIEQHEAFRQEVSDAVESLCNTVFVYEEYLDMRDMLRRRFIIPKPKPDPLVEALADCGVDRFESWADQLRAALEARGLEIREKGQ